MPKPHHIFRAAGLAGPPARGLICRGGKQIGTKFCFYAEAVGRARTSFFACSEVFLDTPPRQPH